MEQELIDRLMVFFDDKEDNRGKAATSRQIAEAETQLEVRFSTDYIKFIEKFGGSYVGVAIHALDGLNAKALGGNSVTKLTQQFRRKHPHIRNTYVISDDGEGNPIMMTPKGEVVIYYKNDYETVLLAPSLNEYLDEVFIIW